MGTRFNEDVFVGGNLSATTMTLPTDSVSNSNVAASAAIGRAKLALETKTYPIPFERFRIHDAFQTTLPGTSATDDLGLYGGTFGSSAPLIRTYDVKNAGAVTLYARAMVQLPAEYEAGENVTLRIKGGMVTTVASATATVDAEVYKMDGAGAIGSDLNATSAASINSLTFGNDDFTITGTTLSPGDVLDIRVAIAVNDSATGTAVIGAIGAIALLCPVRG